ncbi:hypothetical protein BGP_1815 [Beggiatoa sp. PS]|nr:hypothetical protein BGP_1815 [Beggiatoa sp. PS]
MADIQKVSLKEQLEKNLEHLGKMETPVLLSAIQVQKQVRHTVSSWTWKVYTAIIFMTVFGVLIPNSYYINEEWQRAVETRAGEFIRVTGPGLRLKLPFIEKYQQYRIDLQQIQVNQVKVKTKNEKNRKKGYEFEANILLLYRLPEEQIKYIHSKYYDFKKKLEKIIQKRFRIEISQIKMADIPKMRNSIAKQVLKEIKQEIQDINLKLELYDFGILYYSWSEEFRRDIRKADYKKEQMIADKKTQTSILKKNII